MNLPFYVGMVISIPLSIFLHELGHYIPAKLFGWKPKFYHPLKKELLSVEYNPQRQRDKRKLYVVSFSGIIWVAPWLMLFSIAKYINEFALLLIVIAIQVAYSLYETLDR